MGVMFGEFVSTSTLRSSYSLTIENDLFLIAAVSPTGHFLGSDQHDALSKAPMPFIQGCDSS